MWTRRTEKKISNTEDMERPCKALKYPWQEKIVLTCHSQAVCPYINTAQAMMGCDWLNAQEKRLLQSYRANDGLCVLTVDYGGEPVVPSISYS